MNDKPKVMYDSPEAAHTKTVTGWASRNNHFYADGPNAEHFARYDGCTHRTCECGKDMEKHWIKCEKCRQKDSCERYLKKPFKEWDGESPLTTYDDDRYFWDEDDLFDYCEENDISPEDLNLVIAEPQYATEITGECWSDLLPDDQDIGDVYPELAEAIEKVNELIRKKEKPLSWTAGKYRTEVKKREETE
jgi:hypothetical protein